MRLGWRSRVRGRDCPVEGSIRRGGGGGGAGTQKCVYRQLPDQIFPTVNFVFSRDDHFGLGGGGYPMCDIPSGCCVLSAAAADAPAGVVCAFVEPSGWCAGAVAPPPPPRPRNGR